MKTESNFIISRPNILSRIIKNKKIAYSSDLIELEGNIENEIIQLFYYFYDIIIRLTKIQVNSDDQIENNTNILEITTKQLPQDIEKLEKLRKISIKVLHELEQKKIIQPM